MAKRTGSRGLAQTAHKCIFLIAATLLLGLMAGGSAFALTADLIGNYGDITVMAVDGDYDASQPGGTVNSGPREAIAKEFYKSHPDDYDFIFVFTNFDFRMPDQETVAFFHEIRNDIAGIGEKQFDNTWFYGSAGRLQGIIDMGNLANLASDPMDPKFSFTLGTMSHELMHRWAAFTKFEKADGSKTSELLGKDGAHWSFLLDTKGSLMYGNPWQDNGDGTFTSLKGRKYYCPLDLYLMGAIDKSQVPPMLLIDSPQTDKTQVSKPGVTISGTAQYVSIDQIIAAEGERIPDASTSQKHFKMGCILAMRPGTFTGSELPALRSILNNWVLWHSGLTNGRSTVEFQHNQLESLPYNPGPGTQPHQPRQTPAAVEEAIDWLLQEQQADGRWSDSDNTTERDTTAAVRTLNPFARAQTGIDNALQWVAQNSEDIATDYLARVVEALIMAKAPAADFMQDLRNRQNADGAWGADQGYTSSPTDTALALRALMAAGQLDAPLLSETVEFLKLNQNPDGGWGGSVQTSDIQTTANVLVALAPLRVPFELNQTVQTGLYWLFGRQNGDGGFGEGASTVYDTAAALAVLKIYAVAAQYFGPAIEYLQSMQSTDGSWHASVFETAVAAEALYAWKDAVDADLAVNSADIQFSPATIGRMPETVAISATIHNNGLADADAFDVRLYENTISDGSVLGQQSISLAGQSSAVVQFTVSFNDTQDHRLFLVADAGNTVAETDEANNIGLAILSNDLNTQPDLQVSTEDIFFSPAVISQMPAAITLEAVVRNTGLSDVPLTTVTLYQDIVSPGTKVGEQQAAVAAQSSAILHFAFTVIDGDTHRYYVIADEQNQVAERNEFNNTALKLLTSNPSYDFGIRNQDITLSAATVEMGQPVVINAHITNYGNRDGFQIPARFYLVQEGIQYDIATRTFDLPAGAHIDQQVTWTADKSGTDLQVFVQLDPFGAFNEVTEANNLASTLLTVNPYPDPNLTLTYKDITVVPDPALEGQGATVTAQVTNNGGGPANAVRVDLTWNKAGEAPVALGIRNIDALTEGHSATVSWTLDPIAAAGPRQLTVTIDPDNTVKEVSEQDNSAFKTLDVLSLPDFLIQGSSMAFSPPAPADGEPVAITITVQNTGDQDGQNVPVVLFEGQQQIGSSVIASLPGHAQAGVVFNYDTAGKSGTHYLQAVVDPDHTIPEQKTDNNSAGRTLGIQNSDLWLSQSYISANGGADQSDTTLFFRLDQAGDVTVVVVNQDGDIVRTFSGEELLQTTGASITWDGRDQRGALVADGDYQMQVRDPLGNILFSMPVTVDNNLSSLAEAAGTQFLSVKDISCLLPDLSYGWQWFSDESGIVFKINAADDDAPEYPPGVYTMSPRGSDIRLIVPPAWTDGRDPVYDYTFEALSLSADDQMIVVVVRKQNRYARGIEYELWSMDRFGNNPTLIDTQVYRQDDGTYIFDKIRAFEKIQWSPDGARFAYIVSTPDGYSLRLADPHGTQTIALPVESAKQIYDVHWASDGQRLFYVTYDWNDRNESYVCADLSGQTNHVYQLPYRILSDSQQWIDATHFIFTHEDDQQGGDVVVVVDAVNGQVLEDFRNAAGGQYIDGLQVHPDGTGFIFVAGPDDYSTDGDVRVQYCDMSAACETLHHRSKVGTTTGIDGLNWSPRGDKLAFVDSFYEATGENEFAGHVVVINWPSRQMHTFPVAYPVVPQNETPYSFHVYTPQAGLWMEQGVLHYGSTLETKTLALPKLAVDEQGRAVVRIVQNGTDGATVDAVALKTASQKFLPSRAEIVPGGEDILSMVKSQDGNAADVAAVTVEYEWQNLPLQTILTLELRASEFNGSGGDSQGSGANPDGSSQGPYAQMNINGDSLHWLNDDRWLVGSSYPEGALALDTRTGAKKYFDVEWQQPEPSPNGRLLTQTLWVQPDDPCYGRGNEDLWALKSLLNLTAELKVVPKETYLEIRGTAADRNFFQFTLEYAFVETPDQWQQIRPPVETMVIDDLMAQWVPPRAGNYIVRLTAADKAGHLATDSRRIAWGLDSPVSDLYLDDEYISPNGDSIRDALQLRYTVNEPVNLEFYIYDQQTGQRVATLLRSYAAVPPDGGKTGLGWDGRDDTGRLVTDGAYTIAVLGNTYAFVVDNTPPDVAFELTRIECGTEGAEDEPRAFLRAATLDDHFEQWRIEHGEGDSPQLWEVLDSGIKSFGAKTDGQPELETIRVLAPESLSAMAGHKFRLTVEDKAGNRTTVVTERLEQLLVLYAWRESDLSAQGVGGTTSKLGWLQLPVKRLDDGSFGVSAADALEKTYLDTDRHRLEAVNTIRTPLASLVLQYRIGLQWHNGPQIQDPDSGVVAYELAGVIADLDSVNGLRLMAVDKNAVQYYSNIVSTSELFQVGCVSKSGLICSVPLEVYPFEELSYLGLFTGTPSENTAVIEWDNKNGQTVPRGILQIPQNCTFFPLGEKAWISAVGISGEKYGGPADASPLEPCPPPPYSVPDEDATRIAVKYPRSANCSSPSSRTIRVDAFMERMSEMNPARLAYYIRLPDNTQRLLREYDLTTQSWGGVDFDPDALDGDGLRLYPEGIYRLWAVVTLVHIVGGQPQEGQILIEYMLKSDETRRVEDPSLMLARLIVDRTPPQGAVLEPAPGVEICPTMSGASRIVALKGSADDAIGLVSYALDYGYGHSVPEDAWRPALDRDEKPLINFGPAVNGQLGEWYVAKLIDGQVTLRLSLVDVAGNVYCEKYLLNINDGHQLTATVDKKLFSPNAVGEMGEVNVSYTVDRTATIAASALDDAGVVKTIAPGFPFPAGSGELAWDGTDDSHQPVADGIYKVRVTSKDDCGNENRVDLEGIEVDRTPPAVTIAYPQPSDPLGIVVEIQGSVTDLHLAGYRIEFFDETHPDPLQVLTESTGPVQDGLLGRWNTFGEQGVRILKLTAWDTVGNHIEKQVRLDLGSRGNLIKDLSAASDIFSPNHDGKLDSAEVKYVLNTDLKENFDLALDILAADQHSVKTFTLKNVSTGSGSFVWDGRDGSGQPVTDGVYQAVLKASLTAYPSVVHQEKVSIILDATAPHIDITGPVDQAYIPAALAIRGTLSDDNLDSYSLTLADAAGGQVIALSGQTNRNDYTFASLEDLADGAYSLTVQGRDRGQTETRTVLSFVVDKTAPKAVLETPAQSAVYGGDQAAVAIKANLEEDNIAQWQLRYRLQDSGPDAWTVLAQGDSPVAGPVIHSWPVGPAGGVADGPYILSFYVLDKAGWQAEATMNVVVDNTAPAAAISAPADGGYVKAPMAVSGTANDANLETYTVETAPGECAQAVQWSPLGQASQLAVAGTLVQWTALPPDGTYCLRLTARDAARNSSQAMAQVAVDTQPPAAPELSGRLENLSQANLSWTPVADAGLAGYAIYRDGVKIGDALPAATEFVDSGLSQGTYHYSLRAVDLAGWESGSSNIVSLEVDLTPPAAKIGTPRNGAIVADLVEVTGTAFSNDDFKTYRLYAGPGAAPADWQLIAQSAVPTSFGELGQWNTLALTDGGQYSLKLEVEDLAGNVGRDQVLVTVDNSAPAPPVLLSVAVQSAAADTIDVGWQANTEADLAGYLLYRNGQLVNAPGVQVENPALYLISGTAFADAGLPDGTHEYVLIAVDAAGNQSPPSNRLSATVETRAPRAAIVEPAEGYRFDQSFLIRAACPDRDIAAVQFQYQAAGAAQWSNLSPALTAGPYTVYLSPADLSLAYGQYVLRAVATDQSGHTDPAPPTVTVEYRDITPPAVPADLQAVVTGGQVSLTWTANSESDLAGYNVYEVLEGSSVQLNTTLVTQTGFIAGQPDELADKLYRFQIVAADTSGNLSQGSNPVQAEVYTPWMEQPYTPTAEATIALYGQIPGQRQVTLYNDNGSGAQTIGTAGADDQGNFSFDVDLLPGENHLSVVADDGAGNTSKPSEPVVVVRATAPAVPTGLAGTVADHDVTLTWNPNSESDLAGYSLYRDDLKVNADVPETGGSASASTNMSRAAYVRDGNNDTYWYGYVYPDNPPMWWQLNLPARSLINRLELRWNSSSQAAAKFEIQAWSGFAWIPIVSVMGNTDAVNTFDLDPSYATDRLRVVIPPDGPQPNSRSVYLNELRLWRAAPITAETYLDPAVADGTHAYTVLAVNTLGMVSPPSGAVALDVGDVTAPDAPANLLATADGSGGVNLSWTASQAADLAGYHVYKLVDQQWRRLTESTIAATAYAEINLTNGTYTYRVTAQDAVGNESEPSASASAVVAQALPDQPVNVTAGAQPQGGSVQVCWEAVGGAAGYRLYRSTTAGGPYELVTPTTLSATCYLDTGLTDGTAYYYVVHAVDALGNESADSPEADAVPADTSAPAAPVIFAPATAARPATVGQSATRIMGWAEPGSVVTLLKDGRVHDSIQATAADNLTDHTLGIAAGDDVDTWTVSPDGHLAAIALFDSQAGDYVSVILDLVQGTRTVIDGYITDPAWSPDSSTLAYTLGTSDGDRIMTYDTRARAATQLTGTQGYFDEYTAAWSADGRTLFYIGTQFDNAAKLCAYDLENGQAESLVAVTDGRYPSISPDGRYFAFISWSYPRSRLYVYDRQTGGDPQLLDASLWHDAQGRSVVAWSPDGRYLGYVADNGGSTDIYLWNPSDAAINPLTQLGDVHHFAWLADSVHVAFIRAVDPQPDLWMLNLDDKTQRQAGQVIENGDRSSLQAYADGRLGYLGAARLLMLDPAGSFRFSGVPLVPGANTFTATATDAAGNVSAQSRPVVVNVDAALLADLTVKAEEIFSFPYVPIQGDPVTFAAVVRNDGFADARNVQVDCYIWDATDHTELVHSTVIDLLAAGQSKTVQFQWDSSGMAGRTTLVVEADPQDTVFESYEFNNLAFKDLYVAATEGLAMMAAADYDLYNADQDVNIAVELYNADQENDVTLTVEILDSAQRPVASVAQESFTLPYTPLTVRSFVWNTDRTPAGEYYIHCVLTGSSGKLAENLVAFTIEEQLDLKADLVTDRLHYGADQTVQISGSLLNQSPNLDLSDLNTRIVVLNAAGEILAEENGRIAYLFNGDPVSVNMTWPTGVFPSGQYTALLTVTQGAQEIARAQRGFFIDVVARPTGALSVQPSVVTAGRDVSVAYTVGNYGNTPITGLQLAVAIVDPAAGSDLATQNTSADIDPGSEISGAFLFTAAYAPGTYPVQLRAVTAEGQIVLATGSLTVPSDAPLPVAVSGTLAADPQSVSTGEWVTLRYTLTNESHQNIDPLNLRLSVPEPVTGDFQRSLVLPAGATLSGQFVVPTSRLVPDSYTSRLLVSLTGNSGETVLGSATYTVLTPGSNQPPTADAGPDRSVEAGSGCQAGLLLDGSGSTDPDNNPLAYRWTGPFGTVSGATAQVTLPVGVHTVTLTVDDGNGGIAGDDVIITVQDTTAPGILIGGVSDGVDYIDSAAAEVTVTDAACGLASETILLDGEAYTPNTLITGQGRHTLTVEAADTAGNSAQAAVTFNIYLSTELSVSAAGGQYSDPANLSATLTSHGEPVAGKAIHFSLNGTDVGSALTDDNGTATLVHVIDDPGGVVPVSADFAWDGQAYLLAAHAAATMTVSAEDAAVAYTGSLLVAYPDSFTLAARVTQADDGAPGDLGLARVIFDVKRVNPDGSLSDQGLYTLPCDASGLAREEVDFDIGVYAITAAIAGDGYYTPVSETVVAPVYDPLGSFITGGGRIEVTDPENGDLGRGTFGFVVRYINDAVAGNLQFNNHNGEIDLHSTGFDWLVIDGHSAQCQGTGTISNSSEAYTFRMSVADRSAEGLPDQFSIRIWQGADTEADPVYTALNMDLSNGNISVKKD